MMRLLTALLLPCLTFFMLSRPLAGMTALLLQATVIGWVPAALWALYTVNQHKSEQELEGALGRSYLRRRSRII